MGTKNNPAGMMDANAMRQKILAVIAEYGTEQAERQEAEKAEMGRAYDMNSYGAGYDTGLQAAANQLAEMITDLPASEGDAPTPDAEVASGSFSQVTFDIIINQDHAPKEETRS